MDASTVIALGALVVSVLTPTADKLRSGAKRDGKLDAAVAMLTKIADDHEARLRKGRL
jgi:hypothetical protein